MFKDIYKAANDDIKADSALLEKVLQQKKRKKPPILKYSSIAAACAAVAVSLAAVPTFLNKKAPEPVIETAVVTPVPVGSKTETVTDTADKTKQDEVAGNADDAEKSEKKDEAQGSYRGTARNRQSAPAAQKRSASAEQGQSASAEQRQSASAEQRQSESTAQKQQSVSTEQRPQNAAENAPVEDAAAQDSGTEESDQAQGSSAESAAVTEDTDEASVTQNTAGLNKVNTYAKTVVLCVNSEDYGGYYAAGETTEYVADLAEGGYESTEWSMDDYYEYLGENIRAKLSLPADFSYIGDDSMSVSLDSNGVPSLDSMIFPYEGSDGRSVTVMTSKNTLAARAHLEDERYKKSDINGSAAVVIGGGGSYKCYMAEDGISYIVTARGVSENELAGILISIGG